MAAIVAFGALFVAFVALFLAWRAHRRQVRALAALSEACRELEARSGDALHWLRRQDEDLRVLVHTLLEKGVADEDDLDEIRRRCVERPMRLFEEKAELFDRAGIARDDHRIVDDEHGTIH